MAHQMTKDEAALLKRAVDDLVSRLERESQVDEDRHEVGMEMSSERARERVRELTNVVHTLAGTVRHILEDLGSQPRIEIECLSGRNLVEPEHFPPESDGDLLPFRLPGQP